MSTKFINNVQILSNMEAYIVTANNIIHYDLLRANKINTINITNVSLLDSIPNSNIISCTVNDQKAKTLYFYENKNGKLLTSLDLPDTIVQIHMTNKDVVVSTHQKIYIFNLSNFIEKASFETVFTSSKSFDCPISTRHNYILFLEGTKGVIQLADYSTGQVIYNTHIFKNDLSYIKSSPSGRLVACVGDHERSFKVYEFPSMKLFMEFSINMSDQNIISFSFSPSEKYIIISTHTGSIYLVDIHKERSADHVTKFNINDIAVYASFDQNTGLIYLVGKNGRVYKIEIDSIKNLESIKEAFTIIP